MSMWSDRKEASQKEKEEEILRRAAKILAERYPGPDVDDWGNPRYFSS